MRKSIGTLIGAVAISLCIGFSFYSAAQGEKQRKDMDRMPNDVFIAKTRISSPSSDRLSDAYSRSKIQEEERS